jgi:hypothetical protein
MKRTRCLVENPHSLTFSTPFQKGRPCVIGLCRDAPVTRVCLGFYEFSFTLAGLIMRQWGHSEIITARRAAAMLFEPQRCSLFVILDVWWSHVYRPYVDSAQKITKNDTAAYPAEMVGSLLRGPLHNLHVKGDPTLGINVQGVSSSYLYFGMAFVNSEFDLILTGTACSPFCFHHEDKGLCSINYGHYGEPKVWYGTAQKDYKNVVQLLKEFVFDSLFVCLFY